MFGGSFLQPSAELLHRISLGCMNIGGGNRVQNSGEQWVLDHIGKAKFGDKPVIVFDVGANIGDYAEEANMRLKNRTEIYCFEPGQQAFFSLNERFGSKNNVHVYNIGLGDKEETLTLFSEKDGASLRASLYDLRLDHLGLKMSHVEKVQVSTIDLFCESHGINEIDFLKLDVEGHELKVLKGAQRLLDSKRIRVIQFEFGPCNIDSRTFFRDFFYFLNPGFKIFRVLGNGLAPIDGYRATYEVFVTTNYLAILKD
jgi:FkbM family methyltransferase